MVPRNNRYTSSCSLENLNRAEMLPQKAKSTTSAVGVVIYVFYLFYCVQYVRIMILRIWAARIPD